MIEKAIITIPAYDEVENLSDVTHEVLTQAPSVDILIVDDNSPDGTGRLAEELGTKDSRIHVLHRQKKSRLGPAYLAAFAWVSEHGYTWMGEFDTDGSHRPQDLPRLLVAAWGITWPDLVVGSHWIRGDGIRGWSKEHKLLSRAGNFYVNMILNLRIHDATAGLRIYRVDFLNCLLQAVNIGSRGYGFRIEMTWHTRHAAGRIEEVPIIFVKRHTGTSKMSGSIIQKAFARVLHWHVSELLHRGP